MSSPEPVVRVCGVSKRYQITSQAERTVLRSLASRLKGAARRELWALRDVSVEVFRSEGLGIIGLNGAGKTTLLMILAGITQPTGGSVEVRGMLRSPFLGLGAAFQGELNVLDNIRLASALMGLSAPEIDERIERIIAFGELGPYRHAKLKELSSGYQQRVMFSTALHADSDVMLIDEAMSAGDARFSSRCREALKRFQAEGRTVILVSHDLDSIRQSCDRCLYLEGGRVRAVGPSSEIVGLFIEDCRKRAA